jgi:hypothetical protein
MKTIILAIVASVMLAVTTASATECMGRVARTHHGKVSIQTIPEGDPCWIADGQATKVLAMCPVDRFCTVNGISKGCGLDRSGRPLDPKCTEITRVLSVKRGTRVPGYNDEE